MVRKIRICEDVIRVRDDFVLHGYNATGRLIERSVHERVTIGSAVPLQPA